MTIGNTRPNKLIEAFLQTRKFCLKFCQNRNFSHEFSRIDSLDGILTKSLATDSYEWQRVLFKFYRSFNKSKFTRKTAILEEFQTKPFEDLF